MKRFSFLLLGIGLAALACVAVAAAPVLQLLNVDTEAIAFDPVAALVAIAGASMVAWAVVNELVGLGRHDLTGSPWPARFVPPQTGTPEATAFG